MLLVASCKGLHGHSEPKTLATGEENRFMPPLLLFIPPVLLEKVSLSLQRESASENFYSGNLLGFFYITKIHVFINTLKFY